VLSVWTFVTFSQTEIDNVNCIFCLVISSNQKIIRLNVSVNDSLFVHNFDSLNHLNSDVENCLQIKFSSALLEKIF
jgi:hypothetical protein